MVRFKWLVTQICLKNVCYIANIASARNSFDIVMMHDDDQMETFSTLLALCEGNHWIPFTKASDAELWSAPEQTVEQPIETLEIWDTIALIMTIL